MEQKVQGGKRRGAGRKPILNKKKQISLYVESGKIIKFGNEEKMKTHLYNIIDEFGKPETPVISIQDLTRPTGEIKPITDTKPQTNVVYNTLPTKPKASLYDAFVEKIKKCTRIPEIEVVMKEVKAEPMMPREKMQLEALAKEVSKDMFND